MIYVRYKSFNNTWRTSLRWSERHIITFAGLIRLLCKNPKNFLMSTWASAPMSSDLTGGLFSILFWLGNLKKKVFSVKLY